MALVEPITNRDERAEVPCALFRSHVAPNARRSDERHRREHQVRDDECWPGGRRSLSRCPGPSPKAKHKNPNGQPRIEGRTATTTTWT